MKKIPEPTKKRLVLLISILNEWKENRITSLEMSRLLGCKDTLVRYDLKFLEIKPGVSNGYDVQDLLKSIRLALGFAEDKMIFADGVRKCCIVGLGRLGAALLDDGIFEGSGFKVCAGFDSSVNRVEMLRSTFELFPANRIETVCKAQKIEYAFLCCPESETEKMVQRLVNAGIKGIVNYTKSVFALPKNVKVQNVSPSAVLLNM